MFEDTTFLQPSQPDVSQLAPSTSEASHPYLLPIVSTSKGTKKRSYLVYSYDVTFRSLIRAKEARHQAFRDRLSSFGYESL